jgi:hypothetical protein
MNSIQKAIFDLEAIILQFKSTIEIPNVLDYIIQNGRETNLLWIGIVRSTDSSLLHKSVEVLLFQLSENEFEVCCGFRRSGIYVNEYTAKLLLDYSHNLNAPNRTKGTLRRITCWMEVLFERVPFNEEVVFTNIFFLANIKVLFRNRLNVK